MSGKGVYYSAKLPPDDAICRHSGQALHPPAAPPAGRRTLHHHVERAARCCGLLRHSAHALAVSSTEQLPEGIGEAARLVGACRGASGQGLSQPGTHPHLSVPVSQPSPDAEACVSPAKARRRPLARAHSPVAWHHCSLQYSTGQPGSWVLHSSTASWKQDSARTAGQGTCGWMGGRELCSCVCKQDGVREDRGRRAPAWRARAQRSGRPLTRAALRLQRALLLALQCLQAEGVRTWSGQSQRALS